MTIRELAVQAANKICEDAYYASTVSNDSEFNTDWAADIVEIAINKALSAATLGRPRRSSRR